MLNTIREATGDYVEEGNVGAGTGTVCFGFQGDIGTASRKLPLSLDGFTVGVLVQTNFGDVLRIAGLPIGIELGTYSFKENLDGSCMIVIITDASLDARNLKRLAKQAFIGLAQTGDIGSNGSGGYAIAVSTAYRIRHKSSSLFDEVKLLRNGNISLLFMAVIEATEEIIINSLFAGQSLCGYEGNKVEQLAIHKLVQLLKNLT